ncbi:MAG: ParB/RepB/Spo0J family partition protein [Ruminococcaceae bacterium]|nr:ParB/RepB/Spo0J family partition protein [Oscillospiraceae bacterium]
MFWGKIKEISRVVREVPIESVLVPEGRIRRISYDEGLVALADSIREHGIIEPLIVRRESGSQIFGGGEIFQLIAGERRLKAAEILGLATVPCVSIEATDIDAAIIAIIENLHREDLNIFEEAAAIGSLLKLSCMTQEQCARRLSVSQSYVANKLRLLRLTEEERSLILTGGLTERHARALLRLTPGDERLAILNLMIEREMNVASAEEYVESILCAQSRGEEIKRQPEKSERRMKLIIKDIRIFYNSIDHAVDVIKKCGIAVESSRQETADGTLISILLPRAEKIA